MCQAKAEQRRPQQRSGEGSLTAQIASTVISSPGPYSAPMGQSVSSWWRFCRAGGTSESGGCGRFRIVSVTCKDGPVREIE